MNDCRTLPSMNIRHSDGNLIWYDDGTVGRDLPWHTAKTFLSPEYERHRMACLADEMATVRLWSPGPGYDFRSEQCWHCGAVWELPENAWVGEDVVTAGDGSVKARED